MDKKKIKKITKKKTKKTVAKEIRALTGGSKISPLAMLEQHSGFWKSLNDPLGHPGALVPDMNCMRTSPLQAIQRLQLTANAQGVVGIVIQNGRTTSGDALDAFFTVPASTPAALAFLASGPKSFSAQLNTIASRQRLVSAGLFMSYQGATLNDSGRIICNYCPATQAGSGFTNPTPSVNELLIRPYTATYPVSTKFQAVRYLPLDPQSFMFTNMGQNPVGPTSANCGFNTIVCDGMVAGQIVEFTIVENFEFVPINSSLNIFPSYVSKSDPIELSLVTNAIAAEPYKAVATPVSMEAAKSPTVSREAIVSPPVHPDSKETFFEKILNGVEQAIPLAERAIDIGAKYAPAAAGLLSLL